jgi:protease-4
MSFFKTLIKNTISLYLALALFGVTAFIFVFVIFSGIVGSAIESIEGTEGIPTQTFNVKLELSLLDDKVSNEFYWGLSGKDEPLTFYELQQTIKHIEQNEQVNKVLIKINQIPGGLSNYHAISTAIDSLASKKKVLIHSNDYNLKSLLFSKGKAESVIHPLGSVAFKGLGAQILYFHEMLENMGIEAEPIRAGKYKSAIEPYILDSISDANKFQIQELLEDIWSSSIHSISANYNIPEKKLNSIADEIGYMSAEEALKLGLIDTILTWDEVMNINRTIEQVSVSDYFKSYKKEILPNTSDNKIALLCLQGPIMSGTDEDIISEINTTEYLRKVYADSSIKALVVRINSPGGSAMASETIYRALKRVESKIPVVITMGDVAASGGYYIASASDYIFAEPTTITGSIGVYGLMMNFHNLAKKIGVSIQKVQTNELSDFPAMDRSLSEKEKSILTKNVEHTYDLFLKRVAEGRNLTINQVDQIAQGRVWSASDALNERLIDEIGSYNEAIQKAAVLANLSEYSVNMYPKKKTILEKLKDEVESPSIKIAFPKALEELNEYLEEFQTISEMEGPQMRLPFYVKFQ